MSMLGSSTPFKIHDENSTLGSVVKSTSKKGLGGLGGDGVRSVLKKSAPKKGIATPITNTQRKALGDLSQAKLNTVNRFGHMTEGNGDTATKSGKPSVSKSGKSRNMMSNSLGMLSFKLASDEPLNDCDGVDADRVCSASMCL